MRGPAHAALAAVLLAGCGGPPPPPLPGADAHAAMVAQLGGGYIWDCTLTGAAAEGPWRMVLQRQDGPRRHVRLVQAGRAPSRPLEVRENGAARIYTLRDETEITVASDGEAFVSAPGGSRGDGYSDGRCRKGGQPA